MPHIVSSDAVYADVRIAEVTCDNGADVWYEVDKAGFTEDEADATLPVAGLGCTERGMDAVAIDKRARTRSSGYVEPR